MAGATRYIETFPSPDDCDVYHLAEKYGYSITDERLVTGCPKPPEGQAGKWNPKDETADMERIAELLTAIARDKAIEAKKDAENCYSLEHNISLPDHLCPQRSGGGNSRHHQYGVYPKQVHRMHASSSYTIRLHSPRLGAINPLSSKNYQEFTPHGTRHRRRLH